jgi:hypothetical protein
MRIYFEIKATGSGTTYAKIYKNGSAIGTERSTSSLTYVSFTEDLGPFAANDLIQVYAYKVTDNGYIQNFRFQYDRAAVGILGFTLVTPLAVVEQTVFSMTSQDP